jgi:hypothetical protein
MVVFADLCINLGIHGEVKVKVKFSLELATKAQREFGIYISLSLTSALYEVGWSAPRPGRFTAWKEKRYKLYKRLGGFQHRCA